MAIIGFGAAEIQHNRGIVAQSFMNAKGAADI